MWREREKLEHKDLWHKGQEKSVDFIVYRGGTWNDGDIGERGGGLSEGIAEC